MRKIINIMLISVFLMSQTLSAGVLNDALSNVTNVSTYKEGSGTINIYSGSASIRFNTSKTPPPLFVFTPPSIEAGCNGIDIKGMFMSLLGLDQLGEMLTDAGASLAWGVAVGLIYSLPGVASAFKMINSWAKKIQSLLANACNTGIEIGKELAEKSGMNDSELKNDIDGFFNKLGAKEYAKDIQKGQDAVYEAMGMSNLSSSSTPEMTKEEKDDAMVSVFKAALESDASTLGMLLTDIANRSKGSSGTNKAFETKLGITGNSTATSDAITSDTFELTEDRADGLASLININSGNSLTSTSQAKLAMFAYVLQYNFIGDLAITLPDNDSMQELFKIGKLADAGDKQKALTKYKDLKKKKISALHMVSGLGGQMDNKTRGKALADFLWYGLKETSTSTDQAKDRIDFNKYRFIAPKFTVYTIRDKSAKMKSSYISVLPYNLNKGNQPSKYYSASTPTFKGTMAASKCVIDALVDGGGTIPATCSAKGLTFPGIHNYIKIIKDSPIQDKAGLQNKLIKIMSVKMAKALLETIQTSLGQIKAGHSEFLSVSGPNAGSSNEISKNMKETEKAIFDLGQKGSEIINYAYDNINEDLAEGLASEREVETIFADQNRKNHERGMKSFKK